MKYHQKRKLLINFEIASYAYAIRARSYRGSLTQASKLMRFRTHRAGSGGQGTGGCTH